MQLVTGNGTEELTPTRSLAAGPGDGRLRRANENGSLNKGKRKTRDTNDDRSALPHASFMSQGIRRVTPAE